MKADSNPQLLHLSKQLHVKADAHVFSIRWLKKTSGGVYLVSNWNSWYRPSDIEKPSWTDTGRTGLTEVGLELYDTVTKVETCHRIKVDPTDELELLLHEEQGAKSKKSYQFAIEIMKNGKYLIGLDIFGEPYMMNRTISEEI